MYLNLIIKIVTKFLNDSHHYYSIITVVLVVPKAAPLSAGNVSLAGAVVGGGQNERKLSPVVQALPQYLSRKRKRPKTTAGSKLEGRAGTHEANLPEI